MKKLPLSNPSFRYLEKSFAEWLDILGYSDQSRYQMPICVRELLHYLENQQLTNINTLTPSHIKDYYKKLQERSNTIKMVTGNLLFHDTINREYTIILITRVEIVTINKKVPLGKNRIILMQKVVYNYLRKYVTT